MIKKQTIRASATCWWSEEDDAYLVESPLFPGCLVDAQSESEAWEEYDDALNELYIYLLENKALGHDAKGRPPKGTLVNVHMQIRPDSKKILSEMAAQHSLSQGEVVDWVLHMAAHQTKKPSSAPSPDPMQYSTPEKISAELERMNHRISVLESSKKYRASSK
jgi:predicted RNase H-like HicB family nuclease